MLRFLGDFVGVDEVEETAVSSLGKLKRRGVSTVENVEVVNDQLRPAVPRGEFSVDVTNDGDGRAVLDTVVRAEAPHVVNRLP